MDQTAKQIDQNFILEFGEDISSKLLERWPTIFKQKVIQQRKTLLTSSNLEGVIYCAEGASNEKELENFAFGWDSDLASIILLLHLIPPSCQGCKRPGKVSTSQAEKHIVVFQKSGTSIQQHVEAITSTTQPHLLAVRTKKSTIHEFFIVLDKQLTPPPRASECTAR
ncbi:uncharacterized protein LOC105922585 [Fundulus heteroclitus]|uniref:uncharacterized protein LOC105922585 n=1 Tax=Fundulus heteroclitus TaxID=8078 RepID=UPI00165C874C|nr:uncharacterized protein LOC105922585 [Fundulus heteroclitus]